VIKSSQEQAVRVITLNHPPVNALGATMRQELKAQLDHAFSDDSVKAIVLASALPLFCGGADIQEFRTQQLWQSPDLPFLCNYIDNAPKRIIAAINGAAMGGAVEIALACDHRVARRQATMGLPEIKLGLLPGAGGTQRLPRVTNINVALDMILNGNPVSAKAALETGFLDRIIEDDDDFSQAVLAWAEELIENNAPLQRCAQMVVDMQDISSDIFRLKRDDIKQRMPGQLAPLRCIKALEAASTEPLATGLAHEKAFFLELLTNSQARARIHLFFAERAAQKIPDVTQATPQREIKSVAVLGAGTMGTGIAIALINADVPVILLDVSNEQLAQGLQRIQDTLQRAQDKGRLTSTLARQRMALLTSTLHYADISNADLVIEAVSESMSTKQAVFKQLDEICKPRTILASNTSTLDLDAIAAATTRADDVIGLHFFSPANIMKLTEIVRGEQTSPEVINTLLRFSKRINKVPAVVKVCDGFVANRMLEPYFREASRLLLEGATADQVDGVLTDFGMPMGVLSMGDLAGIDVGYLVRQANRSRYAHDPSYQAVQDKLYSLGRYGQKTARGCYRYKGKKKLIDAELPGLCLELAFDLGVQRRKIANQEILERCQRFWISGLAWWPTFLRE